MAGRTSGFKVAVMYVVAWALGTALVTAPWVALRYVPIDVEDWASIYVAGAVGGMALEMLLGRGRLELPSPAAALAKDEEDADPRRPLGPMVDVGFLARVASAGIASVALLLVYYALVGDAVTPEDYNALANDPATFGWAVFLGASSPAIWTAAQRVVEARIAAAEALNAAKLERLHAAAAEAKKDALVEDVRAAQAVLAGAVATGPGVPAGVGAVPGDGWSPVVFADPLTAAPAVEAGAVLGSIEEAVGQAAAAEPGETDVEALAMTLFEQLPATVAGLTGPPTMDPSSPAAGPAAPGGAPAGAEAAAVPPAPAATTAAAASDPVGTALGILQSGLDKV